MNNSLETTLAKIVENKTVVLMGVGNPSRGDDAFGPMLAGSLKNTSMFKTLVCEDVPENYTGVVREIKPDTVLVADAIDLGMSAGDVALIEADDLYDRFSSHKPSLKLLMNYLKCETGAETFLLGVQPDNINFSTKLSPDVKKTLEFVKALLIKLSPTAEEGEF